MKETVRKWTIPCIIAAIWCAASLFYDSRTFTVPVMSMAHNYIPCKLLMFVSVAFFARFIITAVTDRDAFARQVLKYAVIYFIPIIAVLIYKIPEGFLSNDESLIFEQASLLADYTWFYYITTWYYIISMMLIPAWFGPILIKVVIQCLSAGYAVARLRGYMKGSRRAFFIYIAFFLPPILAYTTSAHRIPIYIFLYIIFMFTLFMDKLEGITFSWKHGIPMLILMAVLTQWRTEGIYLAVFGILLMLISYPSLYEDRNKTVSRIIKLIVVSFLIQYIVAIPQYGIIPSRMGDKAANRMLPFYAYTVTNLYRNGLDLTDKTNAASWKKVDRYLDVETIAGINDYLGDINYEDALILYYEGYDGRRVKQADVNLLAYPLALVQGDEAVRRDLEYYEPRLDPTGPAMSYAILALQHARLGNGDKAYALFNKSYKSHLRPPFGVLAETSVGKACYFATGAGGLLQAVINGFCGLELTDEGVVQLPSALPSHWKSVTVTGVGPERKTYRKVQ